MLAALTGLREPVVLVLLLISFFTTISGKPLDGALLLVLAAALAWAIWRSKSESSNELV